MVQDLARPIPGERCQVHERQPKAALVQGAWRRMDVKEGQKCSGEVVNQFFSFVRSFFFLLFRFTG